MWVRIAAFAATVTSAAAASGEMTHWAKVGGWNIMRNGGECSAGFTLSQGGGIFFVSYDLGLDTAVMAITDKALKSVQRNDRFKLKLYFVKGNKLLDDGWGDVNAVGFRTDEDHPGITVKLDGSDLLTDLAISSTVALFRDDVVVESISLAGSAAAVNSLRQCARQANREQPSDPLAGAKEK